MKTFGNCGFRLPHHSDKFGCQKEGRNEIMPITQHACSKCTLWRLHVKPFGFGRRDIAAAPQKGSEGMAPDSKCNHLARPNLLW